MGKNLQELNRHSIQFAVDNDDFLKRTIQDTFSGTVVKDIGFATFFPSNQYNFFCSNSQASSYFMGEVPDNGYFMDVIRKIPSSKPLWYLWSSKSSNEMIQRYLSLDVCNGCCFYLRVGNILKALQFTTHKECSYEQASNFYINNRDSLEKISRQIIGKMDLFLSSFDLVPKASFLTAVDYSPRSKLEGSDFISDDVERTYIYGGKEFRLSSQEQRVLRSLSQGLSYTSCGDLLGLSPRTVEFYTSNIKKKAGIQNRQVLISMYHENNFGSSISL